jgi:hypothetical protein
MENARRKLVVRCPLIGISAMLNRLILERNITKKGRPN